jgi:hypothetical protein
MHRSKRVTLAHRPISFIGLAPCAIDIYGHDRVQLARGTDALEVALGRFTTGDHTATKLPGQDV